MVRYPHLGELVELYDSWKLARARKNLLGALKAISRARFQSLCCIWKTSEGKSVICLASQSPGRPDIPVAPLVDRPSPEACHSSRITAGRRYMPQFPLQADGKTCYVDLRKSFLLPTSHLQEFVCKLQAGHNELAAMELARTKTGYDFLTWLDL